MSIIGTWKVKRLFTFDPEEGMKAISVEEAKKVDDEEIQKMTSMILKISAEGQLIMGMQLPAELLEEAKAQGAPVTEDGMMIAEQHEWKEENGEFFYHTGIEGTVGDEEVSPWEKLNIDADGLLEMMGGMLAFEKE